MGCDRTAARIWRKFGMGGYCGGTDPLESGGSLLDSTIFAGEARFRAARFQGMESHACVSRKIE